MSSSQGPTAKYTQSAIHMNSGNHMARSKKDRREVSSSRRSASISTTSTTRSSSSTSSGNHDRRYESGYAYKRTYVEHVYHDHRKDQLELGEPEEMNDVNTKRQRGPRGGVTVAFPEKLHAMLSRMEDDGTEGVVSWQPHGRCFLIHKKTEFVSEIMCR